MRRSDWTEERWTVTGRDATPEASRLGAIEALVNDRRDGLNLRAQLLFNPVHVEAVFVRDEVDCKTEVTETSRATNSVQVRLGRLREVKVDNHVDSLDVNTARDQIRADEIAARAVAEVVEDAIAVLLSHLGVDVEARRAEVGNLLGKQLDTCDAVAEDDALIDVQLLEERVEALNLLPLVDVGVVLGDTLQSQLLHQVDLVGVRHPLVAESGHRLREGRGETHYLPLLGSVAEQPVNNRLELRRKKLVGLIHDHNSALVKVDDTLVGQVQNTTRSTDDNLHRLLEANDIVAEVSTASRDNNSLLEAGNVLSEHSHNSRRLERKLTSRHQDQHLSVLLLQANPLQAWNQERTGLAGSILGTSKNVTIEEGQGNRLFLNR